MKEEPRYSISESAEMLGVTFAYASHSIRILQIPTAPIRHNARAKGLTESAFQRLKAAIEKAKQPISA